MTLHGPPAKAALVLAVCGVWCVVVVCGGLEGRSLLEGGVGQVPLWPSTPLLPLHPELRVALAGKGAILRQGA